MITRRLGGLQPIFLGEVSVLITIELWSIDADTILRDSMSRKISLHSSNYCTGRSVLQYIEFKIVTLMVYGDQIVFPVELNRSTLIRDQGSVGISCDLMHGSVGRSVRYWVYKSHAKHVCRMAACILGQNKVSLALLMLLSTPWCALCFFSNISDLKVDGMIV